MIALAAFWLARSVRPRRSAVCMHPTGVWVRSGHTEREIAWDDLCDVVFEKNVAIIDVRCGRGISARLKAIATTRSFPEFRREILARVVSTGARGKTG
jgi:hypothetical protein